jgi:hypothetical protein
MAELLGGQVNLIIHPNCRFLKLLTLFNVKSKQLIHALLPKTENKKIRVLEKPDSNLSHQYE